MVDYGSYMRNNSSNDQFTNKLLNVMAFKQNRRKNQISMELMQNQKARAATDETYEDAQRKSASVIRALQAEKLQPGAGKTIAQFEGIEGFDIVGEDVTFVGPKGNQITGPPDNIEKLSKYFSDGNLEAAEEYRSNPENRISVDAPKNLAEAHTRAFSVGNESEMNKATTAMQAAARASRDSRTPQMINAEALAGGGEGESFTKELRDLLKKQGGADRAVKTYVKPDGTLGYLPNNEVPPKGWTPYSTGMEITTPEGTTVRTGVNTNKPIAKATEGTVEKKLIAVNEGLARIGSIGKSWKPEFNEIPTRLGVAWSSIKSKMGVNIPPEEKVRLEEFSAYKQDAIENINLYIKEITGAQMSNAEAGRLRKAQPDPGDGIFGGDDPVTFRSKLVNQNKKLHMIGARYSYYLSKGVSENALKDLINNGHIETIEEFEKRVDDKGSEYETELKKEFPGMDTQSLSDQVKAKLRKEFNVGF